MKAKPFLLNLLVVFSVVVAFVAPPATTFASNISSSAPTAKVVTAQASGFQPVSSKAARFAVSAPLRSIKPTAEPAGAAKAFPARLLPGNRFKPETSIGKVTDLQDRQSPTSMPSPIANFEAGNNTEGVYPPDTEGDIGYDPATSKRYYFQMINLHYQAWDVTNPSTPVSVLGPLPNNSFWTSLGGVCANTNNGDPILVFDEQAHRWLASQFAFPSSGTHQCIAISQTADPTGAWYLYDYQTSATLFMDYPKFGVWPDATYNAYFMTYNEFNASGTAFVGAGAFAFERAKMLTGDPNAQMIYFDEGPVNPNYGGQLPGDLDGAPPAAGTPGYFFELDDTGTVTDTLSIWEFRPDWTTPVNSTFGINGNPNRTLATDNFNTLNTGIPQPGTSQRLDTLADRLMYRAAIRSFGGYTSMLLNHTVDVGSGMAGIQWVEIRDSAGTWGINQQGTYAPSDGVYRWMGSIAQDVQGNMGLGFSVANATDVYPSIRYTGRLAGDPLGTLPQGEATIINGSGNQTGSAGRWGDYSMMGVDPQDQCTFWYTQEYIQVSGGANWQTRVGSFKFPSCAIGPQGTLTGAVTNVATTAPIAGAKVQASSSPTQTFSTVTNGSGGYTLYLPVGTYAVAASAYGFQTANISGQSIVSGMTTTLNIALTPVPLHTVQGVVKDAAAGWPLYAHITMQGTPENPPAPYNDFWTDPVTGHYSVTLAEGITYTFSVNAWVSGYLPATVSVGPLSGNLTQNVALTVDTNSCNAPGYSRSLGSPLLSENFDSVTPPALPAGWAVTPLTKTGSITPTWQTHVGTNNPSGYAAHSAPNLVYFNSYDASSGSTARLYRTSNLALSSGHPSVIFWLFHDTNYATNDNVQVQVSTDGGATWQNVGAPASRYNGTTGWTSYLVDLNAYAGQNIRLGFLGTSQYGSDTHVDDITVANAVCAPQAGGIVVGNTFDANTAAAVSGALVVNDSGGSMVSTATGDPSNPPSFYSLFSPAGSHTFTATKSSYGVVTASPTVILSNTIRQDLFLPTGLLAYAPPALATTLNMGVSATVPFTLTNEGGLAANFQLTERDGGRTIAGPERGAPVKLIMGEHFTSGPLGSKGSAGGESEPGPLAPPWTPAADYPIAIMDNAAAAHNGKVYSVGGTDGSSALNSGYVYDPSSASWSPIASMTDVREKPAAAFINGLLYVVGGWDNIGNPDGKLEIYNPGSNSWTTGAPNPLPFAAGTGVSLGGKFYVIGGCDALNCGFTNVQVYDPGSNSWSAAAPYPEPTSWEACGPISGRIYCAGGTGSSESLHTYAYDPGSNTWTPKANMPQTQWGGGYTVSDGVLYVSGGVGAGSITNQGFAYDPGTNTWTPIANSNNTLYRGGSACGFYKIGGSPGGFNPVQDVEVFPGLSNCEASDDVLWLSESPITGTVAASAQKPITITFDASIPAVDQPGQYLAQLGVASNTPYQVAPVPVTMTVNAPSTWGKVTGVVTGLAYCDAAGAPLHNATVLVDNGAGYTRTLKTDANGVYKLWLDQAKSPLTAIFSYAGYLTKTVTGIAITQQQTTTQNVDLRLNAPCVSVTAPELQANLSLGVSRTIPITLANTGAATTPFQMTEADGGFQPIVIGPLAPVHGSKSGASGHIEYLPKSKSAAPFSAIHNGPIPAVDRQPYIYHGAAPQSLNIIVYSDDPIHQPTTAVEEALQALGLTYTFYGTDSSGANLDAFITAVNAGSWDLVILAQDNWARIDASDYTAVQNQIAGGGKAMVESWAVGYDSTHSSHPLWALMGTSYAAMVSPLAPLYWWQPAHPIFNGVPQFTSVTDVGYSAYGARMTLTGSDNTGLGGFTTSLAPDQAGIVVRSDNKTYYKGLIDAPNSADLNSNGILDIADLWTNAISFIINPTTDVAWLSEVPVTGTLGTPATQPVNVTFDAGKVQQPGTYLATLSAVTNDPIKGVNASPVTMTVPVPATWGQVHGRVYGLGYCDNSPTLLNGAQIMITTTAGVTHTFTQDSQGTPWVWWSAPGPLTVTVSAQDFLTQTVVLPIQTATGINQDFDLRWLHNCGSVSPAPIDLTLAPDSTTVVPIHLLNQGTVSWTWALSDSSTWLSITGPLSGTTGPDGSLPSQLTVDTTGMLVGAVHTALLNVAHDDDLQTNPLLVAVNVIVQIVRGVNVTPTALAQAGAVGTPITYTLQVTNTGNTTDTFNLSVSGNAWTTNVPATLGPLASDASAPVQVVVHIPSSANSGATDSALVTVKSQGDNTKSVSSLLTTTAITSYGLALTPLTASQSALAGTIVTYTLAVTNTSHVVSDTIYFQATGYTWPVYLPTQITLSAGASAPVQVVVHIPSSATGGATDSASVTVKSQGDNTKSVSSLLTTTAITSYGLALTPLTASQSALAGTIVTYTLAVTNTSHVVSDTIYFQATGYTWPVYLPTQVTLGAGASASIAVRVAIPSTASLGSSDHASIIATSQRDPAQSLTSVLTTFVPANRVYLPLIKR